MDFVAQFASKVIHWGALGLLFCFGLLILAVAIMYVIDRTQTRQTIRRNYPVIGRFRYLFEHMGEFFRQYFFALDREELPFNRAERSWVYRAAKKVDTTIAFGSTRPLNIEGDVIFLNDAFPTLDENATDPAPVTIGAHSAREPYTATSIINISGMSFGALSKPAVKALSKGAKEAGCWMNTGEGGLSPYHLEGGCDLVFQIGTAKYGVRGADGKLSEERLKELAAHTQVKMFEIKMSQGAKPGKGGILPAKKVSAEIAEIRGIVKGEASISPNRHPEIESIPDLLNMVERIREVSGKPVGFKMVVGDITFFDELCREILKRGEHCAPDFITLDSADGGTGAAPQPLMDYVGLSIRESLPQVVDIISSHNLRQRIKIIASGKLITPGSVAWALSAGADFVVSARGFMFALGCIQALQCNKNTCPTGITTHKKSLQKGLVPKVKSTRVANYAKKLQYGVGLIAHSCGVPEPRSLQRKHVRIISSDGRSKAFDDVFYHSTSAKESRIPSVELD